MDGYPFEELHRIVAEADDPRIWVFAEWVSWALDRHVPGWTGLLIGSSGGR